MVVIDVSVFIAGIGVLLAVATFWLGRQSAAKTEGEEAGGLVKDIEYIKDSLDKLDKCLNDNVKRLEGRVDELSKQMIELAGNASKAYESATMEHKRLNEHLTREHGQTLVDGNDR